MWKPAVESSAVDGDLAVSEYERDCTLLSLEARVADGADDQRSPEQLTVRAEAHCADGLVAQRKAAGWHVDLMLVARRRWGYGERQRASGIAVGRADGCGAEQSDTPTATRSRYLARICPSPDCCSPHMISVSAPACRGRGSAVSQNLARLPRSRMILGVAEISRSCGGHHGAGLERCAVAAAVSESRVRWWVEPSRSCAGRGARRPRQVAPCLLAPAPQVSGRLRAHGSDRRWSAR